MKSLKYCILAICALLTASLSTAAQEKISDGLTVDKTVHNFGDIMLDSGPVSCTFTVTNNAQTPAVIYNVVSTCGCTDVEWTKEPIRPGKTGKISVTYSNDEGPYPFDKTLTVYVSDAKKPVLLKFRGRSMQEQKPLEELYPVAYGPLGLRESMIKCGNVEQGRQKSDAVMVANLSDKPITVTFDEISDNLSVKVSPNPIPAKGTAEMSFTVDASRDLWGKNSYWATPVLNGKTYRNSEGDSKIGFWAFTKENFSNIDEKEKMSGARPMFKESTFNAGKVKQGDIIHAEFTFTNEGKKPFSVYKVDADAKCWSHSSIPGADPGEKVTFRVHINTKDMPKGEMLTIINLTTNSPLRPVINLFVAGWIE